MKESDKGVHLRVNGSELGAKIRDLYSKTTPGSWESTVGGILATGPDGKYFVCDSGDWGGDIDEDDIAFITFIHENIDLILRFMENRGAVELKREQPMYAQWMLITAYEEELVEAERLLMRCPPGVKGTPLELARLATSDTKRVEDYCTSYSFTTVPYAKLAETTFKYPINKWVKLRKPKKPKLKVVGHKYVELDSRGDPVIKGTDVSALVVFKAHKKGEKLDRFLLNEGVTMAMLLDAIGFIYDNPSFAKGEI